VICMSASTDSLALQQSSDWSRLVVWVKRLSAAGLIVIGLLGGSILVGEWPSEMPGKHDDGHDDTTETRAGPPQITRTTSPTEIGIRWR
jgi:hypothetical protein